ncbi:MAG: hypothetical protein AB7F65_00675 [Dehalococcoidia bacterium]
MSTETQRAAATQAQPEPRDEIAREELCGNHIGDRRVRIQRQPRTVGQKLASIVRRAINR